MSPGARLALALLALAVCCAADTHPELARIETLPDLERRSRQALEFARERLEECLQAYAGDRPEAGRAGLDAISDAVALAVRALQATGKHPRRNPRHFKYAEIRTRRLLEQLRQGQRRAHVDDQQDFDTVIERVEQANGDLLLGIMSRRK